MIFCKHVHSKVIDYYVCVCIYIYIYHLMILLLLVAALNHIHASLYPHADFWPSVLAPPVKQCILVQVLILHINH